MIDNRRFRILTVIDKRPRALDAIIAQRVRPPDTIVSGNGP